MKTQYRTMVANDLAANNMFAGHQDQPQQCTAVTTLMNTPLTIQTIPYIGAEAGQKISQLSDEVLTKVKASDMGELGDGIRQILSLTTKVDINQLSENKSLIGRLRGMFSDGKQRVLAEFNTASEQIDEISKTLGTGLTRMENDAHWLEEAYTANMENLMELKQIIDALTQMHAEQEQILTEMANEHIDTIETMKYNDQKIIVDRLAMQLDKLTRMEHIAKLTAPQIRSMQVTNVNTVSKFNDLICTTIPLWKKQMANGLISSRQRQDLAIANQIDDMTNALMKANATQMGENMVDSAKSMQRSIIDLDTLQYTQTQLIKALKDTQAIESQSKTERLKARDTIADMNNQLKTELLAISRK